METNQVARPIVARLENNPYNKSKNDGTIGDGTSSPKGKSPIRKSKSPNGKSPSRSSPSKRKTPSRHGKKPKDLDAELENESFDLPLGNADSTNAGTVTAIDFWNKVAKVANNGARRVEQVQERTLSLTLLQKDVRCIFAYCGHHPIPKNADDKLMPTRKNEKECINAKDCCPVCF